MRIAATYDGDECKSNTAKIMGNSSYGKLLENPIKYSDAKIVTEKQIKAYRRKPNIRSWNMLNNEEDDLNLYEINMEKTTLKDGLPCHVGDAVLQHSKLPFLRYTSKYFD